MSSRPAADAGIADVTTSFSFVFNEFTIYYYYYYFSFFVTFFLLQFTIFVWINLTTGSGAFIQRQG